MNTSSSPDGDEIPESLMERLRAVARAKELTYYSEVAPLLGIETGNEYFGAQVGHVLDKVNRREFAANRPLLSAVVVSKETMRPGSGYYGCARELRRYKGKNDDEEWLGELMRVHDWWSRH
ncbi:MAG: hypothetical protein M3Z20_16430 [Chloroflexota bacterium]|nr:hypothetical protein [Chloroflexota bacterium]